MVRLSNIIAAFFNTLILLISVATIGASVWILSSPSACHKLLQQPLLILGLSLFVLSFFGLVGSCCRVQFVLWIHLFFMFVLIVGLMCLTVFTVVVTNAGVGQAISGRGYKEHRLGDYSNWLQKYVVNEEHWDEIKSCLVDATVCSSLGGTLDQETLDDFKKRSLSHIQSGCCKPPAYCGLEYKNATFWTVPKTGPAVPDTDCTTWSNNQEELCYDCKSCKAGVLDNLRREWRQLAIINAALLFFVILLYSIGCCAFRGNRSSHYHRYKG